MGFTTSLFTESDFDDYRELQNILEADEDQEDDDNFDMPDDEEDQTEDQADVPANDVGTDDGEDDNFDMPDDGGEGEAAPEDTPDQGQDMGGEAPAGDAGDDGGDDNFDLPEDGGEGGDAGGDGTDTGDTGMDTTADAGPDPDQDLKDAEADIFDNLSDQDKVAKINELKSLYEDLYNRIVTLYDKVNELPKEDDLIKVYNFVIDNLSDLKQFVYDYTSSTFDNKTYLENLINYKKYLSTLNIINGILEEVRQGLYSADK